VVDAYLALLGALIAIFVVLGGGVAVVGLGTILLAAALLTPILVAVVAVTVSTATGYTVWRFLRGLAGARST
jgi:hypothetical protein